MINLPFEINDINGILSALGQMPYVQVRELVEKIQQQAIPQIQAAVQAQAVPQTADQSPVPAEQVATAEQSQPQT